MVVFRCPPEKASPEEQQQQAVRSPTLGRLSPRRRSHSSGPSFLSLHPCSTPRPLSSSSLLRAAARGLYTGGATRSGDSIAARVYGRACRMKECRLPAYACVTQADTLVGGAGGLGGGGCCVRSEGAVGVLSELDLGSAEWVLWHSGVPLLQRCAYVCVCRQMRGWIKSENSRLMGHTHTHSVIS